MHATTPATGARWPNLEEAFNLALGLAVGVEVALALGRMDLVDELDSAIGGTSELVFCVHQQEAALGAMLRTAGWRNAPYALH